MDTEPVISVGYLASPFLAKLDNNQLLKLLRILKKEDIYNYPPDVLRYLLESSSQIFSSLAKESSDVKLGIYESWPGIISFH